MFKSNFTDKPKIKRGDSKRRVSTKSTRSGGAGAVAKAEGEGGGGDSRGSRKGRKASQDPPVTSGILLLDSTVFHSISIRCL